MNSVNLIGNISTDIYLGQSKSGKDNAWFVLAVDGRGEDNTDFIPVRVWNGQSKAVAKYLSKGSKCAVEGVISTWTGADGTKGWEVVGLRVQFLDSRKNGQATEAPEPAVVPDDIPF